MPVQVTQKAAGSRLWRPLADQGNANAQYFLGVMYDGGWGVLQDYAAAASWYQKAADQGNANAQHNLAVMYSIGRGVPQNYVIAHMWYNLAASQEIDRSWSHSSAEGRDFVAAKMTPAQIAEAQRLAREWKAKSIPR